MRNSATALSSTPGMSKRWGWVSRLGTRIHARMKPTTPTGMLMKKIHSQPRPSTSRPPASGPTSVATPAVAPHRPIAAPRLFGGNVRGAAMGLRSEEHTSELQSLMRMSYADLCLEKKTSLHNQHSHFIHHLS